MIAVETYNLESNQQQTSVQVDPWQALQREGATEQALNDLLGFLEDDLMGNCASHAGRFSNE
ncbi:MAG TPA: hypothetical protein VFA74_07510 [Terriglobales bacterium]|nr:hypothetical protein [Terriglobales bacterium]